MALDYTSFNKNPAAEGSPDKAWWKLPKSEIPGAIATTLKFLQDHQGNRQTQTIVSARLYGNLNLLNVSGIAYSKASTIQSGMKDRITYNVCQSVVDTVTAKIAKNQPKPYFLTSDGDYRIQRKAKKLDKFVTGCFYENELYKLGPELFRDACVWGTGVAHVFAYNNRVKVERVLASEIYVDEMEGFYGKPRQLHRVKNIDRQVLIDMFPAHKKDIQNATASRPENSTYENIADQLTVVESWHLKSGPDAKDGFHVISIPETILHQEDYDFDFFPFAFFHWSKRLYGFYGQGLIEQIQNIQLEINKLLWVIQRSMHLAGSFKVLVENGSKIVKEHVNNDIGAIISYTGKTPEYIVPPIVSPEIYAHLMTLKNAAYEQSGVSQLSASSKKPEGLDSGKALREYNDIESDRFMTVGQNYEQMFLDVAKLMICVAKQIYQDDKKLKVQVANKKFVETIAWKDVDMEEDQYVMQIFPVSKLPDDPEGRLATIQEYMSAGLLSPRSGRRLLDFPDLERVEGLANAQEDLLHMVFDKMIEDDEYTAPEPTDDLALAKELALEYLSQGRLNGMEENKLDMIRTFMSQVDELVKKASTPPPPPNTAPQQNTPQPGDGGTGAPQANPMAAPTSNLIPNIPQAA